MRSGMSKQPPVVEIKITGYSKEGFGQGEWILSQKGAPRLVEVPFTKPGDSVLVQIGKKKGHAYQAKPIEWFCHASEKSTPKCKHFGSCGGCRWQHLSYQEQTAIKEEKIRHLFSPFLNGSTIIYPIIPCDPPWQYRNKIELSFSSDKYGKRYLGFVLEGSRGHVFELQECHLVRPWFVCAAQAAFRWWEKSGVDAYHLGCDKGALRTLTLREGVRSKDKMVVLTVSGNPAYALNQKQIDAFIAAMREALIPYQEEGNLSLFLRIQQIAKGRATQFYEMHLFGSDHLREMLSIETEPEKRHLLEFRISPSAFFQPNTLQAERLYSRAIQLTDIPQGGTVFDLYCGTGTLGICMAKKAKKVIGIELSQEAALDARENVKANQLDNVTIYTGDVGKTLPDLLRGTDRAPSAIIVDPPRAGLDQRAIDHLIEIKAPILTYISCNPATQAENAADLIKKGYRLMALQPVDQFPQTPHVENIALFSLEK